MIVIRKLVAQFLTKTHTQPHYQKPTRRNGQKKQPIYQSKFVVALYITIKRCFAIRDSNPDLIPSSYHVKCFRFHSNLKQNHKHLFHCLSVCFCFCFCVTTTPLLTFLFFCFCTSWISMDIMDFS